MGRRRNPWPWSTKGPHKVRVYEREDRPGGGLYLRAWDPEAGRHRRRALGHRDEKRAKMDAERLHLALVEGAKLEPEAVTLMAARLPSQVATLSGWTVMVGGIPLAMSTSSMYQSSLGSLTSVRNLSRNSP